MGLHNLARMTTATTGTGTITLGSAVPSWLSFDEAGVQNGETVTYAIEDGGEREIGRGVYTASGTTLTRAIVLDSTNGGSEIDLSGSAQVFITPAADDLIVRVGTGHSGKVARWVDDTTLTSDTIDAADVVDFGTAVEGVVFPLSSGDINDFATAVKGVTAAEMVGFGSAVDARVFPLSADDITNFGPAVKLVTAAELVGFGTAVDAAVANGFSAREATAAQWRANTADKVLTTDQVWSAMAEVTLTDGATVTIDFAAGFDFVLTAAGNRTFGAVSGLKVGQKGRLRIVHSGAVRTFVWNGDFEFAGGTAPASSANASGDQDIYYYDCIAANRVLITMGASDIS